MEPVPAFIGETQQSKTQESTFVITPKDVGTEAVRPGCMADLEERLEVLLTAAKLVQQRLEQSKIAIGAPYEYALKAGIRVAERP